MTASSPSPAALGLALATACSDYEIQPTALHMSRGEPAIEVSPLLLDFWSVEGGQTEVLSFEIRSVGISVLSVDDLVLEGASSFALVDAFEPLTLFPEQSQAVAVAFSPVEPDELTGTVTVASNDPDEPEVTVDLVGDGIVPWLVISPDEHDFGTLEIPCSESVELVLQNVGRADLLVSDADYDGGGQFDLEDLPAPPFTLAPGAWTTASVGYLASAEGSAAGTLSVTSNDPRGVVTATQSGAAEHAAQQSESFEVPTDPPVDVLFAVDRSASMDDDAASLAAEFAGFADALGTFTNGWHIGVVTFDEGCFNEGVLSAEVEGYASLFEEAVTQGEDADIVNDEALLRLADLALRQTDAGLCNEGFLRDDAVLHVVVVSDEPERSTEIASAWTWDYWADTLQGYLSGAGRLKVSGIVDAGACNEGDAGYAEIIAATGGELLDICSGDWAQHADTLVAATTEDLFSFTLSEQPDADSIVVEVDGVPVEEGWTWDASTNSVVFESRPDGETVTITYGVAASCG